MIQLSERSYIGKCFRPKMISKVTEENVFIGVASWESSEQGTAILTHLEENLKIQFDAEVTRVSTDIDGVSEMSNKMISSLRQTNRYLYLSDNKEEYHSVSEAILLSFSNSRVSWSLLGDFSLFLKTEKDVFPILVQISPLFSQNSALPDRSMGLFEKVQFSSGEFSIQSGHSIFIVSKNNLKSNEIAKSSFDNVDTLAMSLVKMDPDSPFWIHQLLFS